MMRKAELNEKPGLRSSANNQFPVFPYNPVDCSDGLRTFM
jgi:hypothetical protein